MQAPNVTEVSTSSRDDDLEEFFLLLRAALLMIVRWIERKYPPRRKNGRSGDPE